MNSSAHLAHHAHDARRNAHPWPPVLQEQRAALQRMQAERDARDVQTSETAAANEERLTWLSTYQKLAQMRMEAQQAQLAPLMIAAKQGRAELQEAEELQVRRIRTQISFIDVAELPGVEEVQVQCLQTQALFVDLS